MENKKPKSTQLYRHYKGTLYEIVDFANHTETAESLVLYREHGNEDSVLWARPYNMFFGFADNGEKRFTKVDVE
jgi:hypothetical protein